MVLPRGFKKAPVIKGHPEERASVLPMTLAVWTVEPVALWEGQEMDLGDDS